MPSKYRFVKSDIYYPNSDIPKNRLNIKDPQKLHQLESELLEEAYKIFIDELNTATKFDEAYFKALHKRTFETLYDWAGKYRDFNMAKGESRFCDGKYVASYSQKIFQELAQENYLKNYYNKPKEEFAKRLVYYECELIALHPFYELNGRITRLFFDLIAIYNGYEPIDYSKITPQEYIDASIDCVMLADSSKMEQIILKGLKKADR